MWTSELFATRYRATAQGVLFFAARVAVGLLSYVFPTLLAQQGVPFVGTLMIGFLLVALVVGAVWAPDTQGKSLTRDRARSGTASRQALPLQGAGTSTQITSAPREALALTQVCGSPPENVRASPVDSLWVRSEKTISIEPLST